MNARIATVVMLVMLTAVASGLDLCSAQGNTGTKTNQQATQLKPEQWAYFGYVSYGGRLLIDTPLVAVGFQEIPHRGNGFEFDGTRTTFPAATGGYRSAGASEAMLVIKTAGTKKDGTIVTNMTVQAGSQRHQLVFEEKGPTLTINKLHKFDLSGEKALIVVTADGTAKKSTNTRVTKGAFAAATQAREMQFRAMSGGIF